MTMNKRLPTFLALLFGLLASIATLADDHIPDITEEGLHKVKDSRLGLVYADPEADFGIYGRIWLVQPAVAFRKNWQRDQNRHDPFKVKKKDMERMRSDLAALFMEVFTEELAAGGYSLTEEADYDVLLVRPAIVNLDVVSPDTDSASNAYQYAESTGEMSLYVELYDSMTGDLIAKAMDRKVDRKRGYFEWQNRITNRAVADQILKSWAQTLREALDEAHGIGSDED